jgi:hypothetical protein
MSSVAVIVRPDRLLVNMKIMLEDLVMYQEMVAGPVGPYSHAALSSAARRHLF